MFGFFYLQNSQDYAMVVFSSLAFPNPKWGRATDMSLGLQRRVTASPGFAGLRPWLCRLDTSQK